MKWVYFLFTKRILVNFRLYKIKIVANSTHHISKFIDIVSVKCDDMNLI